MGYTHPFTVIHSTFNFPKIQHSLIRIIIMQNYLSENDGYKGWNRCDAERDILEIYRRCEAKVPKEMFCCGKKRCVRELFQLFRYVMRDWGVGKRSEKVLNAIMYADPIIKKEEIERVEEAVIFVEDVEAAKQIEELLRGEGYQESC